MLRPKPELIIALDFPKAEKALGFVDGLGLEATAPVIYKVGLELFISSGPELVRELLHRKKRVFLDLKFHDIPNTVAQAVKQAALLHVEMLTIHLAGGRPLFQAVKEAFGEITELKPKILGVSVLTSFDDVHWAEVTKAMVGRPARTLDAVEGLVAAGVSWGVDGVVCSAHELPMVRSAFPTLYTVVPGIRPAGSQSNDQARVVTPKEATEMGASAIVVGRPITQAPSLEVAKRIVAAILKECGH